MTTFYKKEIESIKDFDIGVMLGLSGNKDLNKQLRLLVEEAGDLPPMLIWKHKRKKLAAVRYNDVWKQGLDYCVRYGDWLILSESQLQYLNAKH